MASGKPHSTFRGRFLAETTLVLVSIFALVTSIVAAFVSFDVSWNLSPSEHQQYYIFTFESEGSPKEQNINSICGPVRQKYAQEHPDSNVDVQSFQVARRDDSSDHKEYEYTCRLIVKPKDN